MVGRQDPPDAAACLRPRRRPGTCGARRLADAGLLHDCAKGNAGLISRVLVSLEQAHLGWPARLASVLPPVRQTVQRLRDHAELSAGLAAGAGCSEQTVELIRWQDDPRDPVAGERLRLADEAS